MKTVAERAAELGLDKKQLIQALQLLSRRKLIYDGMVRANYGYRYYYRRHKVLLPTEQAALALGVLPEDAEREIKLAGPRSWSQREALTAMFEFHKREGRWPKSKEYKNANDLPPYRHWMWLAGNNGNWNVSAKDRWERWIAADRRCTPQMALTLRNTLARKEAIDRIGFETFIKKGMATVRDDDPEWGTLYELPGETTSEPMVLLKVINSTAEPDGSFSEYYLRVPPDQRKAREAVRWTFGGDEMLGSQVYAPLVQT